MLKKLLPVTLLLLLLTSLSLSPGSSYEKCEKFDQTLCEYIRNQTGDKVIRVVVYATENISSKIDEISEVEISHTYGDKYLFQISVSGDKIEELGEIPEVTYVKMPNEPVELNGENNKKADKSNKGVEEEREGNNKEGEGEPKVDTYLIPSIVTLVLIIAFIFVWRLRR